MVRRGKEAKAKAVEKEIQRRQRKRRDKSSEADRKGRKRKKARSSSFSEVSERVFARAKGEAEDEPLPCIEFKGHEDDSSEEEEEGSVFREAPAQTTKTSQLALMSYSQRNPGRLAARLEMKMRSEPAMGPAGASDGPYSSSVSADDDAATVGQPHQFADAKGVARVTVCLDHLARKLPARAVDVLCERIKAFERAAPEGNWTTAQFLEFIPAENASLLKRDEQVYLHREGFPKHEAAKNLGGQKGGKNDRKGNDKGRGKGLRNTKEKDKSVVDLFTDLRPEMAKSLKLFLTTLNYLSVGGRVHPKVKLTPPKAFSKGRS